MINNYASLFNCMPVGRASDYDGPDPKLLFNLVGAGAISSVDSIDDSLLL